MTAIAADTGGGDTADTAPPPAVGALTVAVPLCASVGDGGESVTINAGDRLINTSTDTRVEIEHDSRNQRRVCLLSGDAYLAR